MFLALTFPDLLSKHLRQPQDELLSFCRAVQVGVGGGIFNKHEQRVELDRQLQHHDFALKKYQLFFSTLALAYIELVNLHQETQSND